MSLDALAFSPAKPPRERQQAADCLRLQDTWYSCRARFSIDIACLLNLPRKNVA